MTPIKRMNAMTPIKRMNAMTPIQAIILLRLINDQPVSPKSMDALNKVFG